MARTRAWRRYKNYTKAKRKRDIDINISPSWSPVFFWSSNDGEYVFPNRGMYKNLHQYSKNKIHCSCPWCSPRTRNKGRHRNTKNYAPSINYGMMDKRRQMAMDEDIKILEGNKDMKYVKFFISNGYSGCDYEEVERFDDDITDEELNTICGDLAYGNAEEYEYQARGGWDAEWEDEDDRELYYEDACAYSSWSYITEEEYNGEN